ncbi:uncharacterized protein LOC130655222 [Hydractinia symbiolongicarpus]|uniref:uncharacterized protein LOC130655222 n=1 Tax=Hydractinia symbiolongicarpus TaxID=13093 RepID=UPI0025519A28|nr:uncharacterized protein LOC130655222 [Hydractinia symbiolongicarpus]
MTYLKNIKWSTESVQLKYFIKKYDLPQIVQVEEGYYGLNNDDTFSSGQELKLHSVTREKKVLCYDDNNTPYHIPLSNQETIEIVTDNIVFSTVAELAAAVPLPKHVRMKNGYFFNDNDGSRAIAIDEGDILQVMSHNKIISEEELESQSINFKTSSGETVNLPFSATVDIEIYFEKKKYTLSELFPEDVTDIEPSISFKFTRLPGFELGVLRCKQIYSDDLVIASSTQDKLKYVFTIPQQLELTVKIAEGTIAEDKIYEEIRANYHNFAGLEDEVKTNRSSQIFRTSSEVYRYLYKNSSETKCLLGNKGSQCQTNRPVTHPKFRTMTNNPPLVEREKKPFPANSKKASAYVLPYSHETKHQQKNNNIAPVHVSRETVQTPKPSADTHPVHQNDIMDNQTGGEFISTNATEKAVEDMSVEELCNVLEYLKLESHVDSFRSNLIDGCLLCNLTTEEVTDVGLSRFEAKKLFQFVNGWRPKIL